MTTTTTASAATSSPPLPSFQLYQGDAATVLKDSVASESVDMVFCSPPYWQLRGSTEILAGEIGPEGSYKEYLSKVLAVFNYEVHRVLKRRGTLFIVINDTYNTPKLGNTNGIPTSRGSGTVKQKAGMHERGTSGVNKKLQAGVMPNSALQIPQRLAIAMIDSGKWCLRNDIIWYKRNGQPNTSPSRFGLGDYEHVYFFTKQSAGYYFRPQYEPFTSSSSSAAEGKQKHKRQVWDIPTQPSKESHYSQFPPTLCNICIDAGCPKDGTVCDPFMGSGTTGLAALQAGRNFVGIDISPKSVEIARRRMEFHAGQTHLF